MTRLAYNDQPQSWMWKRAEGICTLEAEGLESKVWSLLQCHMKVCANGSAVEG